MAGARIPELPDQAVLAGAALEILQHRQLLEQLILVVAVAVEELAAAEVLVDLGLHLVFLFRRVLL